MLRRLLDGTWPLRWLPERLSGLLPGALFSDRLRIFLHPQQLVLLRARRGNPDHIVCKKVVPCQLDDTSAISADDRQSLIIASLATALQEDCWRGARPQLLLSNHFVRYALMPWHGGLVNQAERQAFLRHSFQLAYGDAARSWDLRVSDNGIYRSALASGIEQDLLLGLQNTLTQAGFGMGEIYPHLMVAINQMRRQFSHHTCCFVLVESGRLCVALIEGGHWRSVAACRSDGDIAQQVAALLEREAVVGGIDTDGWPVVLYWPEHDGSMEVVLARRRVDWVSPGRPRFARAAADRSDYAMVMWA